MTEGMRGKAWTPFLAIVLASAAAHLWCLGSQFYMDDISQIRDNAGIRSGDFTTSVLTSWTNLWYVVIYKLFGMSPVAFHAMNWLLNTAVACALLGFGRDFIKGKWPAGVAMFAALLFAVHPLGSEIPNYARTQDMAWVTLFSLLAAWAMLLFLRGGQLRILGFCGLAVLGAMFSKGPGLFHAAMAVAMVVCLNLDARHKAFLSRNKWYLVGGIFGLAFTLVMSGILNSWIGGTGDWSNPRFIGHAYTLSRVFWEFAWRAVIPVALSSDHQITETLIPPGTHFWNIPDKGAMIAMVSFLGLSAVSLFLTWRRPTRLFGACLFLFAATILFRFLYLIPEFMPEYRIYPGLPWFCLGAAIALASVWKFLFESISPHVPAVILLAGFAFLSARRSFVWHDSHRLAGDVLNRYPARARALWEMNSRDAERGNWQAIIDRQGSDWPEVERQFVRQNQALAPIREVPSGDFVLAMTGIFGGYGRAVAHVYGPAAGLQVMTALAAHLTQMGLTPDNKPLEWGHFYHDKALILEMAGELSAAAALLRDKHVPPFWPQDLKRIEQKLAAREATLDAPESLPAPR